ncbi:MAG: helix-turn-helix domain-containing protein, partial [Lachnospiraceae bacterium]|nr:helix-turn-helix domain-containing protein [Lachnospiraceae bacterium]
MTFAEKLIELRKQRGWSQEELGERLDVTRQTVSKWELGMTTPEMEKLAAMGELFGITLDELVRGGDSYDVSGQKVIVIDKPRFANGEFKSKKTVRGKPLVHVNLKGRADGFFAVGLMARGVFAVGLLSVGVVSAGL